MLNYILWDVSPVIATVGKISIRWYSLLISSGFLVGFLIIRKIFEKEGVSENDFSKFIQYLFFSTIIGLRLGHCLFYDPVYYLTHPLEILKVWEGGLASHGAALGILTGLFLYVRKYKKSFVWILDRVIIIVCIVGAMVRVGNLMNSEIIGSPTNSKTAFLFVNSIDKYLVKKNKGVFEDSRIYKMGKDTVVNGITYTKMGLEIDFKKQYTKNYITQNMKTVFPKMLEERKSIKANLKLFSPPEFEIKPHKGGLTASTEIWAIPRFPSQLFEAIFYALMFIVYFTIYNRKGKQIYSGVFFGSFLIVLFVFRFLIEFIKKEQVDFETTMLFNMGQLLSVPFIIAGVLILFIALKKKVQLNFSK